jgi:plastocyanin
MDNQETMKHRPDTDVHPNRKQCPPAIALWLPLFLLAHLVGLVPAAAATVWDVSIVGFAFEPTSVTIAAGDAVRWTEMDGASHSSTSDTGLWDSGFLPLNGTFSFTFNSPGTFPYHCAIHPQMIGSIVYSNFASNLPLASA